MRERLIPKGATPISHDREKKEKRKNFRDWAGDEGTCRCEP